MRVITQRNKVLAMIRPDFEIVRGRALPLGATVERGGVNFALFAEHARAVTLSRVALDALCRYRSQSAGRQLRGRSGS